MWDLVGNSNCWFSHHAKAHIFPSFVCGFYGFSSVWSRLIEVGTKHPLRKNVHVIHKFYKLQKLKIFIIFIFLNFLTVLFKTLIVGTR